MISPDVYIGIMKIQWLRAPSSLVCVFAVGNVALSCALVRTDGA